MFDFVCSKLDKRELNFTSFAERWKAHCAEALGLDGKPVSQEGDEEALLPDVRRKAGY